MKKIRFLLLPFMLFIGCTENPTSSTLGGSDVIMRTEIENSHSHTSTSVSKHQLASIGSLDSIIVTNAAFACSDFQIRSDTADTDPTDNLFYQQIRTEQFLLSFDIAGRQYIGEHTTSSGAYHSARFTIHPIAGRADSLALALGPRYLSLFGGTSVSIPGATVVVKGFVYQSGLQIPFTYATNITGDGRVTFDNTLNVMQDGLPIEMIVKFNTSNAFSSGGTLLDPRDPRNAPAINANLKTALHGSY